MRRKSFRPSKSSNQRSRPDPTTARPSSASPARGRKPRKARRSADSCRKPRRRRSSERGSKRKRTSPARRRSRIRLRPVRDGSVWLITKKTNDDLFLLRPDERVCEVLIYLLLLKLNRYGLLLHGFVFMSNHFHLVVTDVRGKLPAFMREFLSESGKALKIALGTTRRIWSPDRYGTTELLDRDAIERALVYMRTNPTQAGQTMPEEWPGLTSCHFRYGGEIRARRPEFYFDERTRPEWVSTTLEPLTEVAGRFERLDSATSDCEEGAEHPERVSSSPSAHPADPSQPGESMGPGVGGTSSSSRDRARGKSFANTFQARIERLTDKSLAIISAERRPRGGGAPRALAGPDEARNTSRMRRGNHHYGRLNPRFMTRDPDRMRLAIEEHREFLSKHEKAKQRYAAGRTRTLFPHGTYEYRERLGVRVARGAGRGLAA